MQFLVEQCVDLSLRSCVYVAEAIKPKVVNTPITPAEKLEIIGPKRVNVSTLKITDEHERLLSSFVNTKISIYKELQRIIKNSTMCDKFKITWGVAYKVQPLNNINKQIYGVDMCHIFKFVSPGEDNEIHVVNHVCPSENISGFSLIG